MRGPVDRTSMFLTPPKRAVSFRIRDAVDGYLRYMQSVVTHNMSGLSRQTAPKLFIQLQNGLVCTTRSDCGDEIPGRGKQADGMEPIW